MRDDRTPSSREDAITHSAFGAKWDEHGIRVYPRKVSSGPSIRPRWSKGTTARAMNEVAVHFRRIVRTYFRDGLAWPTFILGACTGAVAVGIAQAIAQALGIR